jgi:8-oxo-dGTP diphosphatase
MGKRLGKVGNGDWWCPGGHLEFGESIESGMKREILEETGICLDSVVLGPYTEEFFEKEQLHYINLTGIAEIDDLVEPVAMEPTKCAGWEWFDWENLPERHSASYDKLKSFGFNPVHYLE